MGPGQQHPRRTHRYTICDFHYFYQLFENVSILSKEKYTRGLQHTLVYIFEQPEALNCGLTGDRPFDPMRTQSRLLVYKSGHELKWFSMKHIFLLLITF